MVRSFKFSVPEECRDFPLFSLLPTEIRQLIWECHVRTPGLHFLQLKSASDDWLHVESVARRRRRPRDRDSSEDMSDVLREDASPRPRCSAGLVSSSPCIQADQSHYRTLRRQLSVLAQTCAESRRVAQRLCRRQDTLRTRRGDIVCLGGSLDAVFLEYLDHRSYKSNLHLAEVPDCAALGHLRRIAMPYSYAWRPVETRCACWFCRGTSAERPHDRESCCPAHLYQFLARHVPCLEEFFFVDYYIVHRSKSGLACDVDMRRPGLFMRQKPRFWAGNRRYHEANPRDWTVNRGVVLVIEWLRESFVRYAKASPLCQHPQPQSVRFSVLACEWDIAPPPPFHSRSDGTQMAGPLSFGAHQSASSRTVPPQQRGSSLSENGGISRWSRAAAAAGGAEDEELREEAAGGQKSRHSAAARHAHQGQIGHLPAWGTDGKFDFVCQQLERGKAHTVGFLGGP
ncbi:hypothetical protein AAL_02808 [Moelleriella libera RCEF 2490]|uniref:2EXR domain-containing protein n=1 Tax=Moelleriella libera RCEF 2490 TaxID=1081109 RepID=A0A166PPT5_9HYPO|nr:hypothetical protein AAL_02808 [Moelleriella libera RCEF 2490]